MTSTRDTMIETVIRAKNPTGADKAIDQGPRNPQVWDEGKGVDALIAAGFGRVPTRDDLQLGDRVKFTGTVRKAPVYSDVRYEDAPLPGFPGYKWANGWDATFTPYPEGIITGKRIYRSMMNDEGIWIPDGTQSFTAYLVAWHLSRKPVMVRLDQMVFPEEALS